VSANPNKSVIKLALLTTDAREHCREYDKTEPYFGAAPEALLNGFASLPNEIEVHVVACTQRPMASPAKLASNIWFHSLLVPKLGWLRTAYQGCIRAVRAKLRDLRPQIVHGQGTERDCAMCAVFSGLPNVVTIHGNMAELARLFKARVGSFGWLAAHLENYALRRAGGVLCNSAYTETLVRPRSRRTWRVPNPLREQFFVRPLPPPAGQKPLMLNVGVISPRKRQLEILDLAGQLRAKGVELEFNFIGKTIPGDPYSAIFLKRVHEVEHLGYVRYLGCQSVDGLIDSFDRATSLLHFPTEEAFGLVVAEGLARNVKFFGANIGGISDIASDAPGAELFGVDDWTELKAGIVRWLDNGSPKPEDASALMRSRYSPRVIAERHISIYRKLLNGL
jgi:glycosyltransferase involved in cell wall biosynthesis